MDFQEYTFYSIHMNMNVSQNSCSTITYYYDDLLYNEISNIFDVIYAMFSYFFTVKSPRVCFQSFVGYYAVKHILYISEVPEELVK